MIESNGFILRFLGSLKEKYAPSRSFTSNVFTLMMGSTIAQVVSFGVSPVLTRLYRPDEFGMFALFIGIASLVSVVSAGRYEYAIVLPEKEEDAVNVLSLAVILVVVVGMMSLFLIIMLEYFYFDNNFLGKYKGWLYYIPCYIVAAGLYQNLSFWNNRQKNFNYMSISRITLSFCTALISICLGYYRMGAKGLIVGALLGQVAATTVLGWFSYREKKIAVGSICIERMKNNAKRYSNFPKINVLHAMIDNMNSSGIIFVITYYFGAAIVGYYSFMMRIIQAPMGLVSSSLTQVFYQRASEKYAGGEDITGLIKSLIKRLALFALFPALILLTVGPPIFRVVFGNKWEISGVYAQILTPYVYLYFIAAPLTLIPFIVNKQKQALLISTFGNMLVFFSIVIGGAFFHEIEYSLLLYSVSYILYFIIYRKWIMSIACSGRLSFESGR